MNLDELAIVVVARGGSKGLPRKNARQLAGIPLLQWTAEAIRASQLQTAACVLSTEDPEIAALGQSVGLDVPFQRPAALATDEASVVPVVLHAVDWLAENRRSVARWVFLLQPTSPFRQPAALREALQHATEDVDAIVGVKDIHRAPSVLFYAGSEMRLEPLDSKSEIQTRRQTVRTLLTPNGALYLVRIEALRREGTFFPRRTRGLVMDPVASIDIDDATDWAMAEAIAKSGLTWRR